MDSKVVALLFSRVVITGVWTVGWSGEDAVEDNSPDAAFTASCMGSEGASGWVKVFCMNGVGVTLGLLMLDAMLMVFP